MSVEFSGCNRKSHADRVDTSYWRSPKKRRSEPLLSKYFGCLEASHLPVQLSSVKNAEELNNWHVIWDYTIQLCWHGIWHKREFHFHQMVFFWLGTKLHSLALNPKKTSLLTCVAEMVDSCYCCFVVLWDWKSMANLVTSQTHFRTTS